MSSTQQLLTAQAQWFVCREFLVSTMDVHIPAHLRAFTYGHGYSDL
jgi:hypothetical protein